jgi:hypothetical protein
MFCQLQQKPTNLFDFISTLTGKPGLNLQKGERDLASTWLRRGSGPRRKWGVKGKGGEGEEQALNCRQWLHEGQSQRGEPPPVLA